MSLSTITYDNELMHNDLALKSAVNEEDVGQAVLKLGYDDSRLQEGIKLYRQAFDALDSLKEKYKNQIIAGHRLENNARQCRRNYLKLIKLARRAIDRDSEEYVKLELAGRRLTRLGDWLVQARVFFNEALASATIMEMLAIFAISQDQLQAGLQMVDMVVYLEQEHERRKSETQQATLDRNGAFMEMRRWMAAFKEAAYIALEARPQLLEKMGYCVE